MSNDARVIRTNVGRVRSNTEHEERELRKKVKHDPKRLALAARVDAALLREAQRKP